ncbi:MAG: Calx-beta domain-containing protein [Candidatus Peregrinibacteria bacterium]
MRLPSRLFTIAVPSLLAGVLLGGLSMGALATMRGSAVFTDMSEGTFYDEAVGEMYNLNIIKGYSNGTFGPDNPVTRGELAVLLKRLRDDIRGSSYTPTQTTPSSTASTVVSSSSAGAVAANPIGAFTFAMSSFTVPQSIPTMVFSVTRAGGSRGVVSVAYSVKAGTAVVGTDFIEVTNSVLNFRDGEATKTFSIQLKNKSGLSARTVLLSLANPTGGATLGSINTATLTILGSQPVGTASSSAASQTSAGAVSGAGTIGFSAAAYEVSESIGLATITLNRTNGTNGQVGVSYTTSDNTARSGINYQPSAGVITFAAGETTKTFTVAVIYNATPDGKKLLRLNITTPTGGATIAAPSLINLAITDDEVEKPGSGSFLFDNTSVSAPEGANAILTVNRIGGTIGQASVVYTTIAGTALPSKEFTQFSGTLTFFPGEYSKTIAIPILKPGGSIGKNFTVGLSSPTRASLGVTSTAATVTISGS